MVSKTRPKHADGWTNGWTLNNQYFQIFRVTWEENDPFLSFSQWNMTLNRPFQFIFFDKGTTGK
jgi:hypothetical protein